MTKDMMEAHQSHVKIRAQGPLHMRSIETVRVNEVVELMMMEGQSPPAMLTSSSRSSSRSSSSAGGWRPWWP
jgi:hypothetical protein